MKIQRILLAALFCGSLLTYAQDTPVKPDNTKVNKRDRNAGEPAADQQKMNKSDRDLTAQIRKSILTDEEHTKRPEGTTTGVATSGAVGGPLGLLAGIGALAMPGLGPFIAAGPIMGALAGLGVGGAVGGFIGALVGMGIPEYEAKRYEGRVKNGGVLLSVHCDTSEAITRAKDVLTRTGAEDIGSA